MDPLEIILAPAALRELKKLERRELETVIKTLECLSATPRPRGVEKIQGNPKFFRIKAGKSHRVIYHVLQERIVVVLVIRDRKDAYRRLSDLDGKLATALQYIEHEAAAQLRAASSR